MTFISKSRLLKILLLSSEPIKRAIQCIDEGERGIAVVVDTLDNRRLIATITDGDIRRAILADTNLDQPISKLLEVQSKFHHTEPVSSFQGTPNHELLEIMKKEIIRQIPLVDDRKVVVDLVTIDDLQPREDLPIQAVIMAGGEGIRLRPLTSDIPKPMLPVGEKPLLEIIINQLRESGIKNLNIALRYKKEKIIDHFQDGKSFGVDIQYFAENEPLGTAGALSLMEQSNKPILVINGDILTKIDFRGMFLHHQEQDAILTIGVRRVDFVVPFGIVDCDGILVTNISEKPTYNYLVNAGLYFLSPKVYNFLPHGKKIDMTELIQILLEEKQKVVQFPIVEYWMDIGQYKDYQKVQLDLKSRDEGN
jgi:dTDP-glucose pyrophosphorylase/CBS domain-containing protein